MKDTDWASRRRFLRSTGSVFGVVGGAYLAADIGLAHPDEDDGDEPTDDEEEDDVGRRKATVDELQTAFASPERYFDAGERVDDFEDLDEWDVENGSLDVEAVDVYRGSQSARLSLRSDEDGVLEISREFDDLDLSDRTLSLALKLEAPEVEQLTVTVEDDDGDEVRMRRRTITPTYGWFRLDLGITGEDGDPDLSEVEEIRLSMNQDYGQPIELLVDDLRATDRGDGGYVVLTFDDTERTQYTRAFPAMAEYGFPGFAAINPDRVGDDEYLTLDQLRDLQDAGWEIGSHTTDHERLTELENDAIRSQVGDAKAWLLENGFEEGASSFVYPWGSNDPRTRDIVSDYHYLAFTDGSNTHGHQLSGPLTVGRIFGEERDRVDDAIELAAEYDQLVVLSYHEIGRGDWISEEGFRDQMRRIDETDNLEVVTPSFLLTDLFDPPVFESGSNLFD